MKKNKIMCIGIIVIFITGMFLFLINYNNRQLSNVEDIETDDKLVHATYDKTENIWNDAVLGILTIDKIGLKATVKEGTTTEILKDYIGHIEETATYDGNIGLAGHN
ncbi:MAG: hypothetical protein Q4G09_03530, partial [Clostridia bacterium]|nr:hypothetical protein [Clostridia bacterium]